MIYKVKENFIIPNPSNYAFFICLFLYKSLKNQTYSTGKNFGEV